MTDYFDLRSPQDILSAAASTGLRIKCKKGKRDSLRTRLFRAKTEGAKLGEVTGWEDVQITMIDENTLWVGVSSLDAMGIEEIEEGEP